METRNSNSFCVLCVFPGEEGPMIEEYSRIMSQLFVLNVVCYIYSINYCILLLNAANKMFIFTGDMRLFIFINSKVYKCQVSKS